MIKIMKLKKIEDFSKPKKDLRKEKNLCDKNSLYDIGSPHNTNEYLMNINSSSFWNDEDSEDSIKIIPSAIINLKGETNSELFLFNDKEMESTRENTNGQNNQKRLERYIIQS